MSANNADADGGSALALLPHGRFSGPAEFAEHIRLAFATAAAQGWREIIMADRSFEDWPLGERDRKSVV